MIFFTMGTAAQVAPGVLKGIGQTLLWNEQKEEKAS